MTFRSTLITRLIIVGWREAAYCFDIGRVVIDFFVRERSHLSRSEIEIDSHDVGILVRFNPAVNSWRRPPPIGAGRSELRLLWL